MNSKQAPSNTPTRPPSKQSSHGDFCLSKTQRLRTPAEFQRVYSSKQWGGSKHFTFNVLANDLGQSNTLGVTVSKKVSKRAVDRNHLKRVMREFYRHKKVDLNGCSLVLTAKPSSKLATSEERLQSLEELWSKVLKWQRWHHREIAKRENIEAQDVLQTQSLRNPKPK